MGNYVCLSKVLILTIFAMDILGHNIRRPRSKEQIYIEVLKNITRMSKVLEDLLSNYKNLKTKYEIYAKLQNDLSKEPDYYDEAINRKNVANVKDEELRPVTQMIVLDEGFEEESSEKSTENEHTTQNYEYVKVDNNKLDSINLKLKDSENVDDISVDSGIVDFTKKELQKLEGKKKKTPINLSNESDLIIIGTGLTYPQNVSRNSKNEDNKSEVSMSAISKEQNSDKIRGNGIKPSLRDGNDYRYRLNKANNIGYLTDFRSNEVIRGRKLQNIPKIITREDIGYKKDFNDNFGNDLYDNNMIVFVVSKDEGDPKLDSDSDKEDQMLRKELQESKILREAYGNTCLKVAVRKCFKTLMQVKKRICHSAYRCKDSFKEKFRSHSIVACSNEFNYKGPHPTTPHPLTSLNRHDNKKGKKNGNLDTDEIFADITRSGVNDKWYYEVCLPFAISNQDAGNPGASAVTNADSLKPVNVLRDRFERECQRLSMERCERACNYAVRLTCEEYPCARGELSQFRRTCEKECKHAFRITKSSHQSDSDSASGSDSGSDGSFS